MNDSAAPSIALNGSALENLECWPGPYNDAGATATDACIGPVPVTVNGSVNTRMAGNYTLRYTAQDTAGNTSLEVSRSVRINDTVGPAITLTGPNAVTLECMVDTYTDLGATAEDLCSGPAPVTVDTSGINTSVTGPYLARYSASDLSGNTNTAVRNVIVDDSLPPTITLNNPTPDPMVMECATPFNDPGATASDLCQGNVSDTVFVEFTNLDTNRQGDYVVRYQAHDRRGHDVQATRNVRVKDTTPPVLTVVGAPISEIECGTQPDLGVTATDACFPNTATIVATPAQLPNEPGEFDVTYSATDAAGNTTPAAERVSRHFTVVDTTEPVLVVNGPTELYYECTGHAIGNVWSNPGASATDVCEGDIIVHQYNTGDDDGDGVPGDIDPDDFGPGPTTEVEGLYYVQYLAWDESFNIQGAILSVYVQDTLKPVLYLNGEETVQTQCFLPTDDPTDPDDVIEVDQDPYIDAGATGDDQCYGDVTPLVQTFGDINKQAPGTYTIEYQTRDGAFNWADPITRTVEVIDNISPKLKQNPPIKQFPPNPVTMRTVQLSECAVAWDMCVGYMNIMDRAYDLVVTSNEPVSDAGDITIVGNNTFEVRAVLNSDGTQRVYTAQYKVADDVGNFQQGTCRVYVPINTDDPAPTVTGGSEFMAGR
jgi:hypothetical protein